MRLSECIFQGVAGIEDVTRLAPEGKVADLALPPGLKADVVQRLVVACLYPTVVDEAWRESLELDDSSKIAVVLQGGRSTFRVLRRGDAESVRLQRHEENEFRDLVRGAAKVEGALREKLGMPSPEVFYPLGLWRFEADELPEPRPESRFGDNPQIPEVVEQFRLALEVEVVEDKIKGLESRIEDARKALGKASKLEAKLQEGREKLDGIAVNELDDEELELLESKDRRLDEFYKELDRYGEQEDRALDAVHAELPGKPWKGALFWAGVAMIILGLGASIALYDSHRWVALGAIPGFAFAGFEWLRYYHKMGQAGLHKVRLESIRRRINKIREEEIFFRERIDHLLFHAGVENESELQQRLPQAKKLRKIVGQIEDKLGELRQDPAYRKAREEIDRLRVEKRQLEARREEFPEFVMNSFRLEEDLESLGVDPDEVRQWAATHSGEDEGGGGWMEDPFRWLHHAAKDNGQLQKGALRPSVQKMWSKVCGHLLNARFEKLHLTPNGELDVDALTQEQQELWASTRKAEVQTVARALALALQVDSQKRRKGPKGFSAVWMEAPSKTLPSAVAEGMRSVFQSAGRHAQIVICNEAN